MTFVNPIPLSSAKSYIYTSPLLCLSPIPSSILHTLTMPYSTTAISSNSSHIMTKPIITTGPEFIARLPILAASKLLTVYQEECPICMTAYGPDTEDAVMLHCGHIFDRACLSPWLTSTGKSHCPTCRQKLFEKPPRNPFEATILHSRYDVADLRDLDPSEAPASRGEGSLASPRDESSGGLWGRIFGATRVSLWGTGGCIRL